MELVITRDTCGLHEYETHKFSVDASDTGLRSGKWPGLDSRRWRGAPYSSAESSSNL